MAAASSRTWFYARIAITIFAFGALFHFVPAETLLDAARRISPKSFLACLALAWFAQLFSVTRFQFLLAAYGADRAPSWLESLRLFLVSIFYNTYVPGGVAGDVVRAVALRESFSRGGLTSALAVSLVERVIGLAGMLLLVALVTTVAPPLGIEQLLPFSLLGLVAVAGAVVAVMAARRLAPHLPGKLGQIAGSLPVLQRPLPFLLALGSAFLTHLITAFAYHVIIQGLDPKTTLAQSLVIVPVACAAMLLPATIAGAGTREAAFVLLYQRVGVAPADALAMSLSVMLCGLLLALVGGIANLLGPYPRPR